MNNSHIQTVPLEKAYRLITHGPTVLVSANDGQDTDVMAAAWACALEFSPAKVTVVLDKSTKTRKIIENSGYFALQIPTLKQLEMVYSLGTLSLYNDPDKLEQSGVQLFKFADQEIPVVEGCAAWILCELISEPHNQQPMTCLLVRSLPLMPMTRVFRDGHWFYHEVSEEWKSIHHVAGGHFYTIGEAVAVKDAE
jgi:Conserved protein/domain typically associated with flavoprotein oxygenases, DIM6/NTAB family